MGQRSRLFRRRIWQRGRVPSDQPKPEYVPRTEADQARRASRDWLRERDEDDVIEFEEGEG